MRKVIILIILLLFNVAFIYGVNYANNVIEENDFMIYFKDKPEVINEDDEEIIEFTDYEGEEIDTIADKLEKTFLKTPLESHGKFIAENSVKKGVNPYLIGGIILESTACKNECTIVFKQCNNVAGLKGVPGCFGGSYKAYNSIDDSILDLISKIKNDYSDKDMQVPNKMYKSFGKNATWAFKVSNLMEEIKRKK